jgi:MoaA/NifB/PqqE/SkfB family radical SAM enzyme
MVSSINSVRKRPMADRLVKQVLFRSVQNYNILPLTSRCNVSCLFCSHRQNPAGIEAYFLPPLDWETVEDLVMFLSPQKKIVIGESATRIMEGEPFTHPRMMDILRLLREKFPLTGIQLTTNGTLLDEKKVSLLKNLAPLEINLSLNSCSPGMRQIIMHDNLAEEALKAPARLQAAGIPYHGSIVPMPWLTGWEDLAQTVFFLEGKGAQTIRVFLPGFTRYTEEKLQPLPDWEKELLVFLKDLQEKCSVPLTIEPPGLLDLKPIITGVIKGSKAEAAGLRRGQMIISINGLTPFSRVEAFRLLSEPGKYEIRVTGGGTEHIIILEICPGEKSGLVMDYDLPLSLITELFNLGKKAENMLVLASEWGEPLLREALHKTMRPGINITIVPVPNRTFGGTIKSAGLLLVEDFLKVIEDYVQDQEKPDLLVLPGLAFDERGRDLRGRNYQDLVERTGCRVVLV